MEHVIKEGSLKKRVLALHGRGSNSSVTEIQLRNLGVSSSDFDVLYINGPIEASESGLGIEELGGLVSGPWYSWLPSDQGEVLSGSSFRKSLCEAIQTVLACMDEYGPFDGIYGFSQGAVIASLVNGLPHDEALIAALSEHTGRDFTHLSGQDAPFGGVIAACAGASMPLAELRERAGLGAVPAKLPSSQYLHLIGRHDDHKAWSEALATTSNPQFTKVIYLAGGHEVSQLQRHDVALCDAVHHCLRGEGLAPQAPPASTQGEWQTSSSRSFRAVAHDVQIARVRVDTDDLPDTVLGMLAAQPAQAPLLRWARESDPTIHTTYGQLLAFLQPGGEGDLRRLGVRSGDVVAYLAPPGGNATAAAAFLSIASQTCAAPFAASMSEADALNALERYGVRHMIQFAGVSAPGVAAAFTRYAQSGNAHLHHAIASNTAPGLFQYAQTSDGFENQPELVHRPEDYCVMLRTSGSTSAPKVVPLRQRDLVLNAAILADGLGITAADVTYSVMPLDHIGGLSASLLCSVAVGATITCDGQYNPQAMVQALTQSNPKPTWYSAVPTIHNATTRYLLERADTHLDPDGKWRQHALRFIRSGAAALKNADRILLESTFDCPVITTYSMSEQMPISQPMFQAAHAEQGWQQSPDSVGVPVIASMGIVDPATLRPLPFGSIGEVAISGPTVFEGYLNNPRANQQSRFLMPLAEGEALQSWLLTGDLGEIAPDGTLALRGRIKELIKKGGEQVSPFEVEEVLTQHPWVETAVCFSVPSDAYGEEVGCAVVLASSVPDKTHTETVRELREFLRSKSLTAFKVPTQWKLVEDAQLPKTPSQKYIRNGLSKILNLPPQDTSGPESVPSASSASPPVAADGVSAHNPPRVDWATIGGLRFLLACYVMFMHIGSDQSWGAFANLRQWPWHVHAFFVVAGFSLAALMQPPIERKARFVWARVSAMYPLYALALVFAIINLLPSCNPGTFSSVFHWNAQPGDVNRMFCEGTPLLQNSWIANLASTVLVYLGGLSATPLWSASWFLGFYLWFISMYFQCLVVFPFLYNAFYKSRGNTKRLAWLTALVIGLNVVILLGFWFGYAVDATGYPFVDHVTGRKIVPTAAQMQMANKDNAVMLGFYLFAPFWAVYFVAGICVAFLYDAIRPYAHKKAHVWGWVADAITGAIILYSAAHVAQGYIPHTADMARASFDTLFLRPEAANNFMDPGIVHRIWDEVDSRLWAPMTLLWLFALSTGQGLTARILRSNPISVTLAPTAYACFLFHQMVGQWYYALTRHGEWWNWWSYRKDFYWFSPQPLPVQWYEYFYVVGLIVIFGKLVQPLDGVIRLGCARAVQLLKGADSTKTPKKDTLTAILELIRRTTGLEAKPDWSLEECGLASLGVVQFTSALEAAFSTPDRRITLVVSDIMSARTIQEISAIVDSAKPVLSDKPKRSQDVAYPGVAQAARG